MAALMTYTWIASLVLLGCATTSAQSVETVLTGRVVNDINEPLAGAQVLLEQPHLGAIADSIGMFTIRGVQPGRHTIRALAIGHRASVRTIEIERGDSLDLTLRLREQDIPLAGADYPLPAGRALGDAVRLLARVLSDSSFRTKVRTIPLDSVIVWARWRVGADTIIADRNPVLIVTNRCDECATDTATTIEGGTYYTAAIPHINIGVTKSMRSDAYLDFCVALARPGRQLWGNCVSTRVETWISFERVRGRWIRTQSP